jgi:type IV pilus assembly protein PilV
MPVTSKPVGHGERGQRHAVAGAIRRPPAPVRQAGISLIEMLIALLVLSFGLLGMAGLQTYALRNNNNAYYRSQASELANDIVDRMRANRPAAVGDAPVQATIPASAYNVAIGTAPTGGTIAAQDLREWKLLLGGDAVAGTSLGVPLGRLPAGDGEVTCSVTTAMCRVRIQWNDGRTGGARPACNPTTAIGGWTCFEYRTEL